MWVFNIYNIIVVMEYVMEMGQMEEMEHVYVNIIIEVMVVNHVIVLIIII